MPVSRPAAGGTPEAMAIPMQSGSATRKTTMEARKSRDNVDWFFMTGVSSRYPATKGWVLSRSRATGVACGM